MEEKIKKRKNIVEYYEDKTIGKKIPYLTSIPNVKKSEYNLIINLHSCHRDPMSLDKCVDMGKLEMERWNEVKGIEDYIIIHPTGFGNTLFSGVGEKDLFLCLEDIKKRYKINLEKIFLIGFSMGGAGALNIGSKYPHLFCGISSISGYSNYKLWDGPGKNNIKEFEEIETEKREASFNYNNFAHTNVFISHGEWDQGIGGGVDFSHYLDLTEKLNKSNIKYSYKIYKKLSHAEFPIEKRQEVINWINKQKKKILPSKFEFTISDVKHNKFYGIEVLSLLDYSKKGILSGEISNKILYLTTKNIESINIINNSYKKVFINNKEYLGVIKNSKRGLPNPGPISDILNEKIIFCYDDNSKDEFSKNFQEEIAIADLRFLNSLNGGISCGAFRNGSCFFDHEVIALSKLSDVEKNCSIVLYGSPSTNSKLNEIKNKFPFKIGDNKIYLGDLELKGPLGIRFIIPKDYGGYYIINTGTNEKIISKGFGIWYGSLPDYIIYNEKKVIYYGYFDSNWKFSKELLMEAKKCIS